MSHSGCKSSTPSIRSKISTGIWSMPTKMPACRTSRWPSPRRPCRIPRNKSRSAALRPIEVVRAQSTVAQDQQLVTAAQTNLQLEQLLMKNALTRTLKDHTPGNSRGDSNFHDRCSRAGRQIVPTEDLINDALRHRAELVESRIDLNSRDYSNKAVRSALLPTLNSFAYYGGAGRGWQSESVKHSAPTRRQSNSSGALPGSPECPQPYRADSLRRHPRIGGTLNQLS